MTEQIVGGNDNQKTNLLQKKRRKSMFCQCLPWNTPGALFQLHYLLFAGGVVTAFPCWITHPISTPEDKRPWNYVNVSTSSSFIWLIGDTLKWDNCSLSLNPVNGGKWFSFEHVRYSGGVIHLYNYPVTLPTGLHTFHTYVASKFRFAGPSRLSCIIFTTFSLTATPF